MNGWITRQWALVHCIFCFQKLLDAGTNAHKLNLSEMGSATMTNSAHSSSLRITVTNYSAAALLSAAMGLISYWSGEEPGLTALKALCAPLFLLSLGGVNAIFKDPKVEARLTARAVEYFLLHAAVTSAFIAFFAWVPGNAAQQVLGQFAFGFAIFGALNGCALFFRIRTIRRSSSEDAV
jgi:hypothetical protein